MKKLIYIIYAILVTATSIIAQQKDFPQLTGPYLGQKPPGMTPEVFAPGIVSTGLQEIKPTFSPDGKELYYSVSYAVTPTKYKYAVIKMEIINNIWSKPEVASFSGIYDDTSPCFHPDGTQLIFESNRPLGDTSNTAKENFWVLHRVGDGWSKPRPLGKPINGEKNVYGPSLALNGNLYFTKKTDDEGDAIFRSKYIVGQYQMPEKLPENVNSVKHQFDACIAPDESYLIVPVYGREDSKGSTDYYITFRDEHDNWSPLKNMGDLFNTKKVESGPYITTDGKYIFFQSYGFDREYKGFEKPITYSEITKLLNSPMHSSSDIYWVDAKIIEELKQKELK